MEQRIIDEAVYRKRMMALCVRCALPGLPRKRIDRAIMLKSLIQRFSFGVEYREKEVNSIIDAWLMGVAPSMNSDFVTLRRLLVDEGIFERDAQGSSYTLKSTGVRGFEFSSDVDRIEIESELGLARKDLAERRREHLEGSS